MWVRRVVIAHLFLAEDPVEDMAIILNRHDTCMLGSSFDIGNHSAGLLAGLFGPKSAAVFFWLGLTSCRDEFGLANMLIKKVTKSI